MKKTLLQETLHPMKYLPTPERKMYYIVLYVHCPMKKKLSNSRNPDYFPDSISELSI